MSRINSTPPCNEPSKNPPRKTADASAPPFRPKAPASKASTEAMAGAGARRESARARSKDATDKEKSPSDTEIAGSWDGGDVFLLFSRQGDPSGQGAPSGQGNGRADTGISTPSRDMVDASDGISPDLSPD